MINWREDRAIRQSTVPLAEIIESTTFRLTVIRINYNATSTRYHQFSIKWQR